MFYIPHEKLFSPSRYLKVFVTFFGHVGKRPDKNVKINFKIYDVANWETNNYRTRNVQYNKK